MQVTFKIPINDPSKGSLSEEKMTCLVDREQVLNVQKVFTHTEKKKKIKEGKNSYEILEHN